MEIIIILLLLVLIFRDDIKRIRPEQKHTEVKRSISEEEKQKKEELQKAFDNLMSYSINQAIESKKRGE